MAIVPRSWSLTGAIKSSGTTHTATTHSGTDYPQVGDQLFIAVAADSVSEFLPTVNAATGVSLSGTGALGAASTKSAGSYASGAGARLIVYKAYVSGAFDASTSISVTLSDSVAAKAIAVFAVTGLDVATEVDELFPANQTGTWTLSSFTQPFAIAFTSHEGSSVPTPTAGTQLAGIASSGGSGASNAGVVAFYRDGTGSLSNAPTDGARIILSYQPSASNPPTSGSGVGQVTVSGTADGTAPALPPPSGSGVGQVTVSGTASGSTDKSGAGTGQVTISGAADGTAPTIAPASGSGAGQVTASGTASGSTDKSGSGTGVITISGTASGSTDKSGSGTGQVSVSGAASGSTAKSGAGTGQVTITGTASGIKETMRGVKVESGGAWFTVPVKVYNPNNGQWVQAPAKVHNGNAWG